jgi:hypothetical protein
VPVCAGGGELVRPMHPTVIDDHHDLLVSLATSSHHLLDVLAPCLGVKMGHDCVEDRGGALLDRAHDAAPHPADDTAPGALRQPRLAFAGLLAFAVALASWAYREAPAQRFAPPTCTGEDKAPHEGFLCIEPNDCTSTSPGCEGGEGERARREVCGMGIKAAGGH